MRSCIKISLFVFLLTGIFHCSFASEKGHIDSLTTLISKSGKEQKAALLNELCYSLIKAHLSNPDTLEKCRLYANEALLISKETNNTNDEALSLLNLGRVKFYSNGYEKASEYFREALILSEKLGDDLLLADCNKAMGGLYSFWNDLGKAKEYYTKSLEFAIRTDNQELVASILNNVGNIYDKEGDYQSALSHYLRSLSAYEQANSKRGKIYALNNIGYTYQNLEQPDKALEYLENALNMNISINDKQGEAAALTNIGDIYTEKSDYKLAKEYTLASQKIAIKNNFIEFIIANYQRLALICSQLNEFDKAYSYQVKYAEVKDSIFDTEKLKLITEMESKFESLKKEQEIIVLKEKQEFQSQLLYLLVTIAALSLVLVVLLINRHRIKSRLHKKELSRIGVELDTRHRELTSSSIHMSNKNNILKEISAQLDEISGAGEDKMRTKIKTVISSINANMNLDEDWENLRLHFEKVHPDFFTKLTDMCDDLTHNDLKHCAYIRYNLSTKEIARLLNIGSRSVQTARYRLKKKLNIEQDVREFLLKL